MYLHAYTFDVLVEYVCDACIRTYVHMYKYIRTLRKWHLNEMHSHVRMYILAVYTYVHAYVRMYVRTLTLCRSELSHKYQKLVESLEKKRGEVEVLSKTFEAKLRSKEVSSSTVLCVLWYLPTYARTYVGITLCQDTIQVCITIRIFCTMILYNMDQMSSTISKYI